MLFVNLQKSLQIKGLRIKVFKITNQTCFYLLSQCETKKNSSVNLCMFNVAKNCPSKILFKNSNIKTNNYINLQTTNKHTMTYIKINKQIENKQVERKQF